MNAGLPEIKGKLAMLNVLARHLSLHDSLQGLDKLVIESDDWCGGKFDFFNDGLMTIHPSQDPAS
jgi:hypothetical protein